MGVAGRAKEGQDVAIRHKRRAVEARTGRAVESLRRRGLTIDCSVSRALEQFHSLAAAGSSHTAGVAKGLRALCAKMDSAAFFGCLTARRKVADALRTEMAPALRCCVDPANFVMDAVADVFPVGRREMKNPVDLAGACVLILETTRPGPGDRGGTTLAAAGCA